MSHAWAERSLTMDEQRQHQAWIKRRIAAQLALVTRGDRTEIEFPDGIHQTVNQRPLQQPIPRRRRQRPPLFRLPRPINLHTHAQPPCQLARSTKSTRSNPTKPTQQSRTAGPADDQDRVMGLSDLRVRPSRPIGIRAQHDLSPLHFLGCPPQPLEDLLTYARSASDSRTIHFLFMSHLFVQRNVPQI